MRTDPVTHARWLIVVQREQAGLYQHLEARFREIAFVHMILDRRQGERRRQEQGVAADQRRGDRRQPPSAKEREQWALFGYRLVYRGEPVSPTVPSLRRR